MFQSTDENNKTKTKQKTDKKGKHSAKTKHLIKSKTIKQPSGGLPIKPSNQEKNTKTLSKSVFESLRSKDKNKLLANDDAGEDDYDYDSEDNEEDDEGSIHPIGPNVDPKELLSTLTNSKNAIHDKELPGSVSHFSQATLPTFARNQPIVEDDDGTKKPIPGPPRDLEAKIINPRFVALDWMEPLKNPDEVTSYTVYYKMTTSERYARLPVILLRNSNAKTIFPVNAR